MQHTNSIEFAQQIDLVLAGDSAAEEKLDRRLLSRNLSDVEIQTIINKAEAEMKNQNSHAYTLRARMYQLGLGGLQDYSVAIRYYLQAVELNNANAMHLLALMRRHGQGSKPNNQAATELYKKAAALGNSNSMNNLAGMHYRGEGGEVNYAAAIALFERAIELGNITAMYNRALMHRQGRVGEVNFAAAMTLYLDALSNANTEVDAGCIYNATQSISVIVKDHQDELPVELVYRLFNSGFLPDDKISCFYNRAKELLDYICTLPSEMLLQATENMFSKNHALGKLVRPPESIFVRFFGSNSDDEDLLKYTLDRINEPVTNSRSAPLPLVLVPIYECVHKPAPTPALPTMPVQMPEPVPMPAQYASVPFLFTNKMGGLPNVKYLPPLPAPSSDPSQEAKFIPTQRKQAAM